MCIHTSILFFFYNISTYYIIYTITRTGYNITMNDIQRQ